MVEGGAVKKAEEEEMGWCAKSEEGTVDVELEERRRKARIRRERNRQAARKSNQKQKAVRDGLRVELRSVAQRVEVLREREIALRKENLLLRRALSGRG